MAGLVAMLSTSKREVYLCGPDSFVRHTQQLLQYIVGDNLQVHRDTYAF